MRLRAGLIGVLSAAVAPASGADTNADVQRQLQQREQQQLELRLKMQQQIERSTRPPPSAAEDARMRQLDRDRQQRLQQLHDQQIRGTIAPAAPGGESDLERQRALKSGGELDRLGPERQSAPTESGAGR
jgi:hypothetical protein